MIQRKDALAAVAALAMVSACEGDWTAHARPSAAEVAVEDFPRLMRRAGLGDDASPADRWIGEGVELHRVALADDAWIEVVSGAGGEVRSVPERSLPWARADRVTLAVRAEDASAEAPVEVELSFYDPARGNRFWRPLTFEDSDWQELDIDLAYLRYDRGAVPRWEDVASWGLVFRTAGTVAIRGISLWQDGSSASPYLDEHDLRRDFPIPSAVRVADRGSFIVLTDDPRLDFDPVLEALVEMEWRTRRRFPDMQAPDRPVPLLVFASDAGYRSFWRSMAERTGSRVGPLAEDEGYTWMGIATASYNEKYGAVRPTYVHEASHALLERAFGLAAQRSWLFEGLGIIDQLAVSRQDLRYVYAEGIRRTNLEMPLDDLISGAPIPTSRYWQAALLMEWLLLEPERTAALAAAIEDMRLRGSADLRWIVGRHFGLDLPTFTAKFWTWAVETYGR